MSRLLFTLCLACAVGAILPAGLLRAETADSIMESKKIPGPRYKPMKKLGVHRTCTRNQCRNGIRMYCTRWGSNCSCHRIGVC